MNAKQRRLLFWFTIFACSMVLILTSLLAIAGHHNVMATRGDVFDKVLYEANLKWIVPSIIGSVGLLLSGAVGAIGFWFWLREGNLPQGSRKS